MQRAEWLNKMRTQAEALYDHIAPAYWLTFGLYPNATHCRFIEKFLGRFSVPSHILDAGCGAGRYDGMLFEAGHSVLGVDQSGRMLARAREVYPLERFPGLRYDKMSLQQMEFQVQFDGVICMDAMEHICPEDWPLVLDCLRKALKPGGVLLITVEDSESCDLADAYARAKALGLPVVYGEVVADLDASYAQVPGLDWQSLFGDVADQAVYHFYPAMDKVHAWFHQAGFVVEEEGTGDGYHHLMALAPN